MTRMHLVDSAGFAGTINQVASVSGGLSSCFFGYNVSGMNFRNMENMKGYDQWLI